MTLFIALSRAQLPLASSAAGRRSASLLLRAAARAIADPPLSAALSLSVLRKHLRCRTHGMLQAPVSRAHTHA